MTRRTRGSDAGFAVDDRIRTGKPIVPITGFYGSSVAPTRRFRRRIESIVIDRPRRDGADYGSRSESRDTSPSSAACGSIRSIVSPGSFVSGVSSVDSS